MLVRGASGVRRNRPFATRTTGDQMKPTGSNFPFNMSADGHASQRSSTVA
jgi:hypothetical protein